MGKRLMAGAAVLVMSVAGLVGVAATTASAGPGSPVGAFDRVSARFDGVWQVSGWATDGDTPGAPLEVRLYLGGTFIGRVMTGDARPDVAAAVPGAGPSTGWHSTISNFTLYVHGNGNPLCAYAINVGAGANRLLGCQSLPTSGNSPFNPVGNLEAVSQSPGILNLRGWAADPDGDPTTQLRVYVNGKPVLQTPAALSRPDVTRFGLSATSGFDLTLPMLQGRRSVCVYAQNTGFAGLQNSTVGCATTTIPGATLVPGPHDPVGSWDVASPDSATGWAYDPDSSAPVTVRFMKIGSFPTTELREFTTDVQTGVARPDVQNAIPAAGPTSGFDAEGFGGDAEPAWVCAYVRNVGPGTDRFLGCATWFGPFQLLHEGGSYYWSIVRGTYTDAGGPGPFLWG